MAGRIIAIIGLVGMGIAVGVLFASAMAPELTDGRSSYRESFPFMVIGGICSCVSYIVLAVGAVMLMLSGRKKAEPPAAK